MIEDIGTTISCIDDFPWRHSEVCRTGHDGHPRSLHHEGARIIYALQRTTHWCRLDGLRSERRDISCRGKNIYYSLWSRRLCMSPYINRVPLKIVIKELHTPSTFCITRWRKCHRKALRSIEALMEKVWRNRKFIIGSDGLNIDTIILYLGWRGGVCIFYKKGSI